MSDPTGSSVLGSQVHGSEMVLRDRVKETWQRILLSTTMKLVKSASACQHTYEKSMEALKITNGNLDK